jgi:hypothetical protein
MENYLLHFLCGFFLTSWGRFHWFLYVSPVVAGIGKEVYDLSGRGTPDPLDFLCVVVGMFTYVFMHWRRNGKLPCKAR